MATIKNKVLFFTTSPRTPEKMIPEITLLDEKFHGQSWNSDTQTRFMEILRVENFFDGEGKNDPALSARDRINRAPKSLGFVRLNPISLSSAGQALISGKRTSEIFLRQMLKFQLPSPYHKPTESAAKFCVKPYLEIFRLVRDLGTLRFDEMRLFGLQLTDYHKYDDIVKKINDFRIAKAKKTDSYKKFYHDYAMKELRTVYAQEIVAGNTKTRETDDNSIKKFLDTKFQNMRDYADACFRYLRATGLVNISYVGKSISIDPDRRSEVNYFLRTTDREPVYADNLTGYEAYLQDSRLPRLLTDDRGYLISKLSSEFPEIIIDQNATVDTLRDILDTNISKRKQYILKKQVVDMKEFRLYDDIQSTFDQILNNNLYDAPLMLEWNTWRAMTMLDGGIINANLKFDDYGKPMATAQGNVADIVCDYQDFSVAVEVTTASGQRQYEMESEPVARHLGKIKTSTQKPAYCLFVAPTINEACIAHFYALHKMNIAYYGGTTVIVPLPLKIFQKMVEDSCHAAYIPTPEHVKQFFLYSSEVAVACNSEKEWYERITDKALHWLD